MKRFTTTLMLLLLVVSFSFANKVEVEKARTVAQTFLKQTRNDGNNTNLFLAHSYEIITPSVFLPDVMEVVPLLYVFNIGDDNGIIIVSGDDVASPVLGYTDLGHYDLDNLPHNFKKWIEGYKSQIYYAIENKLEAIPEVERQWSTLTNSEELDYGSDNTMLSPLCSTTWSQSPYYNSMCPGGSVTGCVATAMAQVMKFWNHPAQGTGMHSYNHQVYGTLTANFGATTYQWSSMPNSINSNNTAIATIMYHCGVSVDMGYTPDESGAWVIEDDSPVCSESAFKNYFGYSTSLHGEKRKNFTTSEWLQMMYTDLDAGKPLVYAGFGTGGGHCFVCDGYNSGDYFHFNWGWGGYQDGYFHIDALDPGGTGTGGGTGGYNSDHQAIFGLVPETTTSYDDLRLYNQSIVVAPVNIALNEAFTVTADVGNFGTAAFTGEFTAYVFDNSGNAIGTVETFGGTIGSSEWYTLTFETTGMSALLPGNYTVSVYYKPSGGSWMRVGDGDYSNTASLSVGNASDIELYSNWNISCGTTITQNEAFNVDIDIANFGGSTFYGTVDISLYDLDGYFVETIQAFYNEALASNTYYNYTFSSYGVTVAPGTYLMALLHKPDFGSWTLSGSSYHQNPIQVIVRTPSVQVDVYEPNDAENNATNLNLSFVGNSASVNTSGSNSDNGSDYDYYNINLPTGYEYTLTARVHDSYNSGNGQVYTNDVLWSYTDGSFWSMAYDDIMYGNIVISNGGNVTFLVAPYFLGETGTYLLDIQAVRTPLGIEDELSNSSLTIFPNPVTNTLNIDGVSNINSVQILDISGRVILNLDNLNESGIGYSIPITKLDAGTYILNIKTDDRTYQRKFIKTE